MFELLYVCALTDTTRPHSFIICSAIKRECVCVCAFGAKCFFVLRLSHKCTPPLAAISFD